MTNITVRADTLEDLNKQIDEAKAPKAFKELVHAAVKQLPAVKDYVQLTAFVTEDNVVLNLSTHANDG